MLVMAAQRTQIQIRFGSIGIDFPDVNTSSSFRQLKWIVFFFCWKISTGHCHWIYLHRRARLYMFYFLIFISISNKFFSLSFRKFWNFNVFFGSKWRATKKSMIFWYTWNKSDDVYVDKFFLLLLSIAILQRFCRSIFNTPKYCKVVSSCYSHCCKMKTSHIRHHRRCRRRCRLKIGFITDCAFVYEL